MGVRFPLVANNTIQAATVVTTTETVVAISQPLTLPLDSAQVLVYAYVFFTPGTAATSAQIRIRRGTTTAGASISAGTLTFVVTAGVTIGPFFFYPDTPGAAAGQQYCATLQQQAATGNATIQDVAIAAFAL